MQERIVAARPFRIRNIVALLAFAGATFVGTFSAHAVTCEDVRHLSTAEQNYWSKVLHLTAQERHLIWVACYKDYRANSRQQLEQIVRR